MILLLALAAQAEDVERELADVWGPLLGRVELLDAALTDALAEMKEAQDPPPNALPEKHKDFWTFRLEWALMPARIDLHERAMGVPSLRELWLKHAAPLGPEPPPPSKVALSPELARAARDGYAEARKKHAALLAKDDAAALRWTERQIRDLYQPLVQLNARGLAAVKGYTKLNADDGDQARWKVWAEREFLPRNAETAAVLLSRFGLLEDGPTDAIRAFILHQHSWSARHAAWKKSGVDYEWGSRTNWPVAFSLECEQTYQKLLDRRARLVLGEK